MFSEKNKISGLGNGGMQGWVHHEQLMFSKGKSIFEVGWISMNECGH